MGFVNLQTSFAQLSLLKWLSKAEGDGVRQFYKKTLRPLSLLKWLSKAEGDGVRLSHELPLRPLFLLKWLSKAEGDGVHLLHKSCKHPLPAPPSPWRGGGGEALMLRLYSKLVFFLWFSLFFRIFHQT